MEVPLHSIPEPIDNNEVRACLTNNRAFQVPSTAPMGAPITNSGPFVSSTTPNALSMDQGDENVGCVLPSTSVQTLLSMAF